MKAEDQVDDEVQINYSLNSKKDTIIQHHSDGIITQLKNYQGLITVLKIKPIIQTKTMNLYIYQDIMCQISNYINQKMENLQMCSISQQDENFNRIQALFQLKHGIIYESGFQYDEKEIDNAINDICFQINEICMETYDNGDSMLTQEIDKKLKQYDKYFN